MKISLEKDIDALSNVKSRMPEIFAEAALTHRPKIVTQNGKPIGILSDIGSYETMVRKINMLKMIVEGEESGADKESISLEVLKRKMKKKYGV
jgi:hypothetical protein